MTNTSQTSIPLNYRINSFRWPPGVMDNIILTLHPITDAAWTVLKDPCNANLLNTNNYDNAASQGEPSAFSLTLDRAPKTGPDFIIGRHRDADILLRDPASSTRHCIISINDTGVPFLFEQSTNGTLINGKHCKNQSFKIQGGMQIDIRDAAFEIRLPWRDSYQLDYEYKARRVKESRARTPVESPPSRSAPIHTILIETLSSYALTDVFIDSLKVVNKEVGRTEIVRKGNSLFAAKRFNRKALGQRELRA